MNITVTCPEGNELESRVYINITDSKEELQEEFNTTGSKNEHVVSHEEIAEPNAIVNLLDAISAVSMEGQEGLEEILTKIYLLGFKRGVEQGCLKRGEEIQGPEHGKLFLFKKEN